LEDTVERTPKMWIGVGAALLAVVACLCALATMAVLAAYRGAGRNPLVITPTIHLSSPSPVSATPIHSVTKATASPASDRWPLSDIPMPPETDLDTLIGPPDDFSVFTEQDFAEVLAFYQSEMEALGWERVSYGTRITESDAELHYRKGDAHATLILAQIPYIGTLIEIRLRPA
jgi:hypothetical protein